MSMPVRGSTAVLFVAVIASAVSTSIESVRDPRKSACPISAFCGQANLRLRPERCVSTSDRPQQLRTSAPVPHAGPRRFSRASFSALEMIGSTSTGFEIRKASTNVGGVGCFLRTPEVLQLIIDDRTEKLEEELLPKLKETLDKLAPKEKELAELQKKYDDTENEVFGSQILPLEVSMRPLIEIRTDQQEEIDELKNEIEALTETKRQAVEKFAPGSTANLLLAGRSKRVDVPLRRHFAFGSEAEASIELSGGENREPLKLQSEWPSKKDGLPLFIEADSEGMLAKGMLIGFATPEEGPRRFSAVAEWKGPTDSDDIAKRKQALLDHISNEGLVALDAPSTRVSFEGDPIPFRRFNELWVTVAAPEGVKWYDFAAKLATDQPAKNASAFSLKDCPWAAPRAWLDPDDLPDLEGVGISWTATSGMSSNKLSCTLAAPPPGFAVAMDHASSGELALSFVELPEEGDEEEAAEMYAVVGVQGWPLRRDAIEGARRTLVQQLSDAGYEAADAGSFRVLVRGAGNTQMWMAVQAT